MPEDTGLRVKRREVWVDLPGPDYEGFRFRLWVNPPARVSLRLAAGGVDSCRQMILEHNGWCDADGNPYPQPSEAEFYMTVPSELLGLVLRLAEQEIQRLPNSIATQRRR